LVAKLKAKKPTKFNIIRGNILFACRDQASASGSFRGGRNSQQRLFALGLTGLFSA